MPVYEYKALSIKGRKMEGIITAEGPSGARLKLSQRSIFPIDIREVTGKGKTGRTSSSLFSGSLGFGRVSPVEVTMAMRQLATLVSSGMPILECLDVLIAQTERNRLERIFIQVREKVVEGNSSYAYVAIS